MQRIERLYAIAERIRQQAPATLSAATLAEELEVSRRTVERDLAALRNAGVPLYGLPGRTGGTGSVSRARRVVTFDEAEIVSLVIAAHLASGAPYAAAGRTAVAKLLDMLDEPDRVAVEQLRDRCRIAADRSVRVRPRVRSVVEDAVRLQQVVHLTYTDRNGAQTWRDVEPVGLYFADGVWALVGWCRLRRDGRMFLLHRVERATLRREGFAARDVDEVLGWVPTPGGRP